MHTRKSGRTSPLLHNPEIEKSARANKKAAKASSSVTTDNPIYSPGVSESSFESEESEFSSSEEEMADQPERGVDSYYRPGEYTDASPIVYAAANANNN